MVLLKGAEAETSSTIKSYLHSNMVLLKVILVTKAEASSTTFTFQYGSIKGTT